MDHNLRLKAHLGPEEFIHTAYNNVFVMHLVREDEGRRHQ